MKLAIVHDFLNQYGGAEKTLEALHELYTDAPVFTSILLPRRLPPAFSSWDIRVSFLQRLPFLEKHFKKYLLLYPRAMERFDLSAFDAVLSSSSAFAKGVRARPGALHVCYCYTPMRFVWDSAHYLAKERIPFFYRPFLKSALSYLKEWDLRTIGSVTRFIAISRHIQARIRAAYGRWSEVIYPPVETSRFLVSQSRDDYFLIVSRLNAYKNIDMAVQAFNQWGRPLVVVGEGPRRAALQRAAKKNVTFLGRVPADELVRLYSRCRAFVFPGSEDFGIAPVEAMASGRPVIALAAGGALETVVPGETGVFFEKPEVDSLLQVLRDFENRAFDSARIRRHAEKFDKAVFKDKIAAFLKKRLNAEC